MFINNININKFNARILDVNIQNSSVKNLSDLNFKNELLPYYLNSEISLNNITVTLLLDSKTKKQYYIDKSNILNKMLEPFEVYFSDRDLKFKCILINQMDQPSLKQVRGRLQLVFVGYNEGNEITENMNRVSEKILNVAGNTKVPIILEINPTIDMIDLKICGLSEEAIIIKNLKGNKKIIINGIEGTVLQEGINKFTDTEMWEFPFLKPGTNKIILSKNTCDLKIKYNPRYL